MRQFMHGLGTLSVKSTDGERQEDVRQEFRSKHHSAGPMGQGVISERAGATPKLRVVYLDHVAQLSGGELALLRLIQALSDVDAHTILAEDGPLLGRLIQAGISAEVLPMHRRTRQLRKDSVQPGLLPLAAVWDTLTYTLRLAWRLHRLRPDVVHTNSLKAGVYGSVAAHWAGLPVVWHLRDRIDPDYLPRFGVILIRTLMHRLADVVIVNSEATRQTLRPHTRSVVVPSLVEQMEAEADPAPAAPDQVLVVGIVGRLAPWKGQDVFLRAFAKAFPEGGQRAVIVGAPLFGEAESRYGEGLRQLSEELGIADRVDFRGHSADIAQELRAMSVLVHASTLPEPFGQVVLEGMSARLPVVASRGGGPEEVITHGVDGLLYPRGDVAALAQILARLDADPQLRAQLGRAAARRTQDFSAAAIVPRIMRAYQAARKRPA